MNSFAIESDFIACMSEFGLTTRDAIVADGQLHRVHVEGDKPRTKNGWYILFSDGVPSAVFGNWKTGCKKAWCSKEWKCLSHTERVTTRQRIEQARMARECESQANRAMAAKKAFGIWCKSLPASDVHPYLLKKGVKCYGLRLLGNALVIPLRDGFGALHSLQFIDVLGNKRFLSGGRKQGCYFSIGTHAGRICVAEGYATAASIHEATGHAVAVAFDAGNMLAVAQTLRRKFPETEIMLCADCDPVGLSSAAKAASAIHGIVRVAE